jgi:DNA polymerase III subunit epsilon
MRFYSLDVETANPDQASICQIGIGIFENDKLVKTWKSYINPQDYFHWRFVEIHGIDSETVKRKPTFSRVYPKLKRLLENNIVVHHSPFDRIAFHKVFIKYGLEPFEVKWLDSVKVAKKAFGDGCLEGGYNLANLAAYLNIEFQHHDALEDSIACGIITTLAIKKIKTDMLKIYSRIH